MTDTPTKRPLGPSREAEPATEREIAGVAARLDRQTAWSRAALTIDRLVAGLWPLFSTVAGFLAVTALGLWPRIGDWPRFALLALFAALLIFSVVYFVRGFRWPRRAEARARLDEGAPDRPVASFDEELALGVDDAASEGLWAAHRRHVARAAAAARAASPSFRVGGERDPFALRIFASLGLGAALLLGPSTADFADAFAPPGAGARVAANPTSVELWATPPVYTGAPPIYFADAEARRGARTAPVGTVLSLRVFDARSAPTLEAAGVAEDAVLVDEGDGVYAAALTLTDDAQIALSADGEALVDLAFTVTPDGSPTVEIADTPARGRDGALTFSFHADDDYGVVSATARITLDPESASKGPPEARDAVEVPLPTPPSGRRALAAAEEDGSEAERVAQAVEESFVGHPWVGLPVVMTVVVEDGAGQRAESAPERFELPGRLFSEPMAKALMEQRGDLVWHAALAPRVNRTLEALLRFPDDYFTDPAAYLMARSATSRLGYALSDDRFEAEREGIVEGLYQAAVRLEDGGLENAAERLARAQRRLREAIENGASQEELAQLMQELRAAIDEYLQALSELAERNPELLEQFSQQEGQSLSRDQLQEMLDALEQAARDGAQSEAEQMLSMLQQLLDSLRPGGQSQQAGDGSQGQEGQSALNELQDMIGEQQGLAERSFDEFLRRRRDGQTGQDGQEGQQGQQGQQQGPEGQDGQLGQRPGEEGEGGQPRAGSGEGERAERGGPGGDAPSLRDLEQRQQALRDALRGFREGLNEELGSSGDPADRALDDAERSMRQAERALERDSPGEAAEEQMRAVDALRDGARAAAEALREAEERAAAQEGEQQPGEDGGQGEAFSESAQDPLGRATGDGGAFDGGDVDVPGASAASRARDILDELRRRAGERERPLLELEYLERLLERFR